MVCVEPTRRFPSAGDSPWRSSSQQPTSATSGSTQHSVSGKVSSTKRKAQLATKATYTDTTNLASKYAAFPLFCWIPLRFFTSDQAHADHKPQIMSTKESLSSRNYNKKRGFLRIHELCPIAV